MKKSSLNKILNDGFWPFYKQNGFKKGKFRYIMLNNGYEIHCGYSIIDYGSLFPTTFGYSMSSSIIDNLFSFIFKEGLERKILVGENSVSLYENNKYLIPEYEIKSEDDANKMIQEVTKYMQEIALPYLNSINNFNSLDKLINDNNQEPLHGSKGLIIAKMAENPNYEVLKQKYRQLFIDKNWAVKKDIENLETVINFLDKHTKEELEAIVKT